MSDGLEGRCLCGAVTITVRGAHLRVPQAEYEQKNPFVQGDAR